MEKTDNSYEELLREHQGLFKMKIKMPVRDNKSLALIYTPGVAASCLEIQKDNQKALKYTNKMNAVLVVSDSSGFPNVVDKKEWNNMAVIPYLEATCVYYKNLANIDAYPLVLDFSKINSEEQLLETVNAIMPAYSHIEFFQMCPNRLKGFADLKLKEEKNSYSFLDSSCKRKLDDEIKETKIEISAHSIYAAVLRAVLDTQAYGNVNCVLEHTVCEVKKNNIKCFIETLKIATNFILENNLSTLKGNSEFNLNKEELSTEYVVKKFKAYQYLGADGWVDEFPYGYLSPQHDNDENSLLLHSRYKGVVSGGSKINSNHRKDLDRLFTWENLDRISNILLKNPEEASNLTCKANLGSIITNSTAVLGLGDIGPLAGLPVMEGKSVLFKLFGGTDILPICVNEKDPKKFIEIIDRITPIFSIINLEDIKSPECFLIEPQLNEMTDYPVFHDDQHGTAVVVVSGVINALKLKNMNIADVKIVMNGAGAAGLSITDLLIESGAKNFVICDTKGAIYKGRTEGMNSFKEKLAEKTNINKETGNLSDIIKGADIFIGVSAGGALKKEMVALMNENPVIFALANPTPEILPEDAKSVRECIVATGRSDFPNQVNNSLAFPGIFRAAVDVKARNITIKMKIAAAKAIADLVPESKLNSEYIIPGSLDTGVSQVVCKAVAEEAIRSGENKDTNFTSDLILENIKSWFREEKLLNLSTIKKKNVQWKR